ncbi:MAG: hypothetical protein EAZ24_14435, partial [Burkholderiales bacterium]
TIAEMRIVRIKLRNRMFISNLYWEVHNTAVPRLDTLAKARHNTRSRRLCLMDRCAADSWIATQRMFAR